jgi:hypothetical protein
LQLRDRLARPVEFQGFDDPKTPLQEALDNLAARYDLKFDIDEAAFKAEMIADVENVLIAESRPLRPMKDVPLRVVLRKILSRVPATYPATYVIRDGLIQITTEAALHAEFWPKAPDGPYFPLVTAVFDKRPLREALQELAADGERSRVIDERVGDRGQAPVTATFVNAPLDTAAQTLADAADLKVVVRGTVLYVTTRERPSEPEKR